MSKEVMHTALIALVAFAAVSMIQQKVFKVPGVGKYLPGGD